MASGGSALLKGGAQAKVYRLWVHRIAIMTNFIALGLQGPTACYAAPPDVLIGLTLPVKAAVGFNCGCARGRDAVPKRSAFIRGVAKSFVQRQFLLPGTSPARAQVQGGGREEELQGTPEGVPCRSYTLEWAGCSST